MGINEHRGRQAHPVACVGSPNFTAPVPCGTQDVLQYPGLKNVNTVLAGLVQQHRVQRLTANGQAPWELFVGSTGQVGLHGLVPTQQRQLSQNGPAAQVKGPANAKCFEQWQIAGGNTFTTHLSPWKAVFFDHGNRPSRAGQQNRR